MRLVFVLDCNDPVALAPFWEAVLDYRQARVLGPYVVLAPKRERNTALILQRVPESKTGKNRMHLDIHVDDLEGECARVEALGARRISGLIEEDDCRWYVMADPEGNEFCVIEPPSSARPD